jgi:hypothetical protein
MNVANTRTPPPGATAEQRNNYEHAYGIQF